MSGVYFKTLASWWFAQSWVEMPCWIDRAEVKTSTDSDSIASFQQGAAAELEKYVGGQKSFRCCVNPKQPGDGRRGGQERP
ncbi:hypothetical protein BH11VER1_BH11VER1_10220 [soil metagenome]